MAAKPRPDVDLGDLLSGGDRRSLARSKQALAIVRSEPSRVGELVELAAGADWLVTMRAVDLLEKLARERVEWVAPYKGLFVGPLADHESWEIRLQVVRALPLFEWTPRERRRALAILRRDAEHPQAFVRAWSADSFASLAAQDPRLLPEATRMLEELERSGKKSLAARARSIRERLARAKTAAPRRGRAAAIAKKSGRARRD